MKIFSDRLKKARGTASQAAFSKAAGISRAALANYEAGIREPDLATFRSIAEAAGVTADWLLGMTSNPATDRGGVKNLAANSPGAAVGDGARVIHPATDDELRAVRKDLAALVQRVESLSRRRG